MKAYFDDQIFTSQKWGGASRYFVELMRAFRSDASYGIELTNRTIWTQNHHLLETGLGRRLLPGRVARNGAGIRLANRLRRNQGSTNLIHHTYYIERYLYRYAECRLRVVTVYDMIPEIFPEMFPHGNPHQEKRTFVDSADLILCISEATKRDLIRMYGVPTAPVVVTHLGVDQTFRPDAPRVASMPDRYVLYVGRREAYKDFSVFAEAFANSRVPNDVMLVLVGGGPLTTLDLAFLKHLGLAGRVLRRDLSDAHLPGAYANALCFVFPSRHEGFGLPTLEAMAAGCPAILVDASSHPEIGGDAALYFNPGDVTELSRLVTDLVADPELRAHYRDAGLKRAAGYGWNETARVTAAAYFACSEANSR